jgi:hypothetical protein
MYWLNSGGIPDMFKGRSSGGDFFAIIKDVSFRKNFMPNEDIKNQYFARHYHFSWSGPEVFTSRHSLENSPVFSAVLFVLF